MKEKIKGWSVPFLTLSLLATSNLHKYPIFHMDVGLWIYSTTDSNNSCPWEVLIFTFSLSTDMNWLWFNLKLKTGKRIEVPSPVTPESATGTLSTHINPKLTQVSWGCRSVTKAELMKEESDVLMRRQIISHGSCLPLRNQSTHLILMYYFIFVLISPLQVPAIWSIKHLRVFIWGISVSIIIQDLFRWV